MIVGYARTSTEEQKAGIEDQIARLKALGCEKVYHEQVSSMASRAKLEAALDFVREGDTLVVMKLDRLARSISHLGQIIERLEAKGCALRIVDLGVDTGTPTGKLILTVMGGIAQFEREVMLERQRVGVKKAKEDGKFKGRVPTARRQTAAVMDLKAQGKPIAEIMKTLKMSRASVYRIIQENEALAA